jgi:hypothetical protein
LTAKSAREARLNRAQRHFQNLGDLVVRVVLQIKQGDRSLKSFVQLRQRRQHLRGVQAVDRGRCHHGQFGGGVFQFDVREARLLPARGKKFAVQGGEQPGFHFGDVAQLMAFACPDAERLLDKIARVRLYARQTEGELIQRRVITGHQIFKIYTVSHIAASRVRVASGTFVPVKCEFEIVGNIIRLHPSH